MYHKLTKRQIASLEKATTHRQQRAQLKEQQRRRQAERASRRPPPPRRRDWRQDDDAVDQPEGVPRPAGPPARRGEGDPADREAPVGTIVEVRSGDSLVAVDGRVLRALLPRGVSAPGAAARSPLAVGDRVRLRPLDRDLARIVAALPRRSALSRHVLDPSRRSGVHQVQVLAANVDQVVVVCSPAEPPFRPGLIDRYLVAASRDSLPATLCLNKADLGVPEEVERYLQGYARLGVRCLRTSALTGRGLESLREALAGRASLLTGHSGVGKSTLLNALEPGLALRVGAVTGSTAGQGKGRHTTSSARLVPLSTAGTFVVDTPGIRALAVRGMPPEELASHFPDIAAVAEGCLYSDCLHRGERGCAVLEAARGDALLRERLASYRLLLAELE